MTCRPSATIATQSPNADSPTDAATRRKSRLRRRLGGRVVSRVRCSWATTLGRHRKRTIRRAQRGIVPSRGGLTLRAMLNARLFGPLALELNGEAIPQIAGLRPRSVLAWLLLNPGPHSRAHVEARFWPEVLDTSARASLRTTLSAIRAALKTVGAIECLEADRASVGITAHLPREIDVEAFERLAAADDPGSLKQAFELARAPLLSDLADDWVLEARDEYRDRLVDVALRLADDCERGDDLARAIAWTRQALIYARVRESVHRALMRRLAAAGERAEALDAYARLSAILAAEFGTPPSAETRTLATELSAPRGSGRRSG